MSIKITVVITAEDSAMQMRILWLETGRHHPCRYGCIIHGAFPKLIIYLAVPPHKPTCRMKSQPRQHPEGSTEWCFRWIRSPEPSLFLMKWRHPLNTHVHTLIATRCQCATLSLPALTRTEVGTGLGFLTSLVVVPLPVCVLSGRSCPHFSLQQSCQGTFSRERH